ncbi:MAG: GWxTD domain-containing protein [Thermoanaerobaculia bacterium]|nr:GWxTD domain-containing protein [Thermoanaerobaculia bacterium]
MAHRTLVSSSSQRRRVVTVAVLLGLFLAALGGIVVAAPVELPALFQKAKAQFERGEYSLALVTLDQVWEISKRPGLEWDQLQLAPVVAFYRAACLAMTGQEEDSVEEFEVFLQLRPGAEFAKDSYPEPVVQALKTARRSLKKQGLDRGYGLQALFSRFSPSVGALDVGEDWADSAVRFFLSSEQKDTWKKLSEPVARWEFVENFWKELDPTPETPENELRMEVERRLLFADAAFSTETTRGRETDRGLVFSLLGAPSFVTVAQITGAEDPIEAIRGPARSRASSTFYFDNPFTQDNNLSSDLNQGSRESWRYRGQEVPEFISHPELAFDFITKTGYGEGVLERDPKILGVLAGVADHLGSSLAPH